MAHTDDPGIYHLLYVLIISASFQQSDGYGHALWNNWNLLSSPQGGLLNNNKNNNDNNNSWNLLSSLQGGLLFTSPRLFSRSLAPCRAPPCSSCRPWWPWFSHLLPTSSPFPPLLWFAYRGKDVFSESLEKIPVLVSSSIGNWFYLLFKNLLSLVSLSFVLCNFTLDSFLNKRKHFFYFFFFRSLQEGVFWPSLTSGKSHSPPFSLSWTLPPNSTYLKAFRWRSLDITRFQGSLRYKHE